MDINLWDFNLIVGYGMISDILLKKIKLTANL